MIFSAFLVSNEVSKTSYNVILCAGLAVADLKLQVRVCHVKISTYNSVFGVI